MHLPLAIVVVVLANTLLERVLLSFCYCLLKSY